MKNKRTLLLSLLFISCLYLTLTSSSGGINGQSVAGCTCHNATASPNTLVTLTGLPAGGYTNGTVYPITVSVTNTVITAAAGGFGLRDGFDLTSSGGSFTAIAGTALNGATEIRHNTPKAPVGGTASWTFNWTAPASGSANVSFNVSGNATNGDGGAAAPDSWNQTSATIYKAGAVLAVTASAPSIACNGGVSTITATGSGPTIPYQYSKNGVSFQTATTFTNNLAGTYTITVRDAALNTATTLVTITQPTTIVASASNTPILCNGATSTITASGTGGTGAFFYRLNAGAFQSSPTFLNNLAATYTVTARDANLCTKTTLLVISQPTAMVFAAPSLTPPLCNGGTGTASVSASGGTGSKTYTITPLGPQSNATGNFTGLTSQAYTVTATDGNNCTKTTVINMTQPVLLTFAAPTITSPPCNGGLGTLSVSASGGTGTKTYTITPLGPQSNITGNFTALTSQSYTVTVTDANNCSKTTVINMPQPSLLNFSTSVINDPLCHGGTGNATVSASGGTGTITYTISPLGPQSNTSGNFTSLTAQTYTVTATDINNCTKTTVINISEPTLLNFTAPTLADPLCYGGTGSASVSATGGTGLLTYTISSSGPQSNNSGNFTGLNAQTYTVTVTDINNCSVNTNINISQPPPLVVTADNVSGCNGSPITLIGSPSGGVFSLPNPYTGPSTTYTYTYTDGNGCTATSAPASITVTSCSNTLLVKLFLQGYYNGMGTMVPALYNQGASASTTVTDSITIELRDSNAPYGIIQSKNAALNTDGTAQCDFDSNGTFYLAIRHRNAIQTWSAAPVSLNPITFYDFSNSIFQAYGNNMIEIDFGICAFYSGDVTQDENADLLDIAVIEADINDFVFGYATTDLNGDGNVDLLDTPVLENNVNNFIFSNHP